MAKYCGKGRRKARELYSDWNHKIKGWQGSGARKARGLGPRDGRT